MKLFLALTASGSMLLVLLIHLRMLFGKRFSSTAYYYAWLLVMLRFLIPLPGLISYGKPQQAEEMRTELSMAAPVRTERAAEAHTAEFSETGSAERWADLPAIQMASGSASEHAKPQFRLNWKSPALWLSVWAIGAAAAFCFYSVSFFRFSRQIRRSLLEARESDLRVYESFRFRKPELARCAGILTPMTCGVFHQRILLPDLDYEDDVLKNILSHELMHYRRKDTLYKWFAVLVYAVQWFNPLTYLMQQEVYRACELSCDEMLMRHMDRKARQKYGETLLSMAAKATVPSGVVATTFATDKKNLKERLEQIMEFQINTRRILSSLLAFVLLISCAVLTGPKSSAEQYAGGPVTEVTVSNVDELLDAIAPETVITLKAGEYDLSKASTYGGPKRGAYWRWEQVYDGFELVLENLNSLTIQGEGKDVVTISAVPRYATVLNFSSCGNVTLRGFTAGHSEAPAYCAGNVLGFNNCQETTIDACGLFGCGVIGVYAQNCAEMAVTNSEIYDCTYGAVYLSGSRNIVFDSCTIRDHASAWVDPVGYLFYLDSSDNVEIRNSVIRDNYAQNLLVMGYSRNVVFAGNIVEKNSFLGGVFSSERNSPVVESCSFVNNSIYTWYEGNGVFAVDAEGRTLGREELEAMARREIGADEHFVPERKEASGIELISPAEDGAYHVNTVDEFLSVIGSNRTIILEAEYYNLADASDYGTPGGEYYFWRENYDGTELVITGVHDLTIDSKKEGYDSMAAMHHTISAEPRYANVLSFQYCEKINLLNFTAGHTEAPGMCSGGVLYFQNCSTIHIASCRMYGCGTLGIEASNCSTLWVDGSEIYDCSWGGVSLWNVTGALFDDCSIHDVDGAALTAYECGDVTWNRKVMSNLEGQYDIAEDGSLTEYSWGSYESYNDTEYTAPAEMNPVIAKRLAEGELRRLQDLGIINPDLAFEGDLEYCAYSDGYENYNRVSTHGFYARDYSEKHLINFRIDDEVRGDIRWASFEAAADEDDEITGSVEWDGETFYYYDNFDDIFPADLTVGKLCDLLAQYWGFTGWRMADTFDPFYNEEFKAPAEDLLVSELPEGNYYATVYFDGDQEGAPMFIQKTHFPGRVCFMFGEGHAVG